MDLQKLRRLNIKETKAKLNDPGPELVLHRLLSAYTEIEKSLENLKKKGIKELKSLEKSKKDYEKKIKKLVKKLAPKTADVASEILTARLIHLAGSLEKLARMPSSKIQVLGAEKAFFKHLKLGTKAPKYGVIFLHESVRTAENKGKTARQLANEIAKKAKIDYYSK